MRSLDAIAIVRARGFEDSFNYGGDKLSTATVAAAAVTTHDEQSLQSQTVQARWVQCQWHVSRRPGGWRGGAGGAAGPCFISYTGIK